MPGSDTAGRASAWPRRSAWVEIDVEGLRRNFELINRDKPPQVRLLSVVKDEAYGHGMLAVAGAALDSGATMLAVSNLHEAMTLRDAGVRAPILVLGERTDDELAWCVENDLACAVSDRAAVERLAEHARRRAKTAAVHVKIDTGMSRYGIRWTDAPGLVAVAARLDPIRLEGAFSHFAQSDEKDKTFALIQLERFLEVLRAIERDGIPLPLRHLCNSGGFLDLPQAHFDMVRLGILPLGVYPSSVCRRTPGLKPVMTVKARIAALRALEPGDVVGYGMRYRAETRRRIAVLPIGYADGYPRVRNTGFVLIRGRRAPVVGGAAMDAITVDVTDIPDVECWDEAVLMGSQGNDTITVHDVASWKGTVSYEVLSAWRSRLPRLYLTP